MSTKNFLPEQYRKNDELPISHNYLREQFEDPNEVLEGIRDLVRRGDYTLGEAVDRFEEQIVELTGSPYAIGVGSGTDAILLSLKAAGIGPGDEVVTCPFTFFATVGAIATSGARPVFADAGWDCNIDPGAIESAITNRTKAIVPIHWSGRACEMEPILEIADRHGVAIVEDACHGIRAAYCDRPLGTFGLTGCFSMHPLKNLNVWGDGGYLITANAEIANRIRLLRNHGLINRDQTNVWGYNSRLDTLQAIVASHLLPRVDNITDARIANATAYDKLLGRISGIHLPERSPVRREVFHLYVLRCERRDELQKYLISRGIDAKVHYPIPMHLQPAARDLGHQQGDFPIAEALCDSVLSLPVHEYIRTEQIEFVAAEIGRFYEG